MLFSVNGTEGGKTARKEVQQIDKKVRSGARDGTRAET